MKAVIVEIKDKNVAALCADGRIIKMKNKHYMIGQEINMKSSNNIMKFAASAAAALVVFAVPAWAYLTPYSYVSIDVNPSIEFSLNRFDKVLSIKAVNDDGQELLEHIDLNELKNDDINEAVKEVVKEIKESGFFSGEESGLVVAASSKTEEKTNNLKNKVKTSVEDEINDGNDDDLEENGKTDSNKENENESDVNKTSDDSLEIESETKNTDNIEIDAIGVGQERVEKARELGVTPGKLNLVEKLQASDPTKVYKTEDWLKKSVKDIQKEIKANEKDAKEKEAKEKENKKSEKATDNKSNSTNSENDINSKNKKSKN
ncbi:MAG: hypothetical protein K0Q97_1176 [Bacillota bacterium]|nr:hypothetical protein [Bacillota bacterium]